MNAQEYYINIRPGNGFAETIKISQYDVGRPLSFHLMDGAGPLAIPSGSTVTIRGTKPSGLGFTEDCTISGSTASVSTTLGMSQEFGFFPVELVVAYNDDVIATGNAMLLVEMSPHQDGTTDGTAEDLQDIYEQIDDLKEDIGDLDDLETTDKSNLVAAINEARGTGGGGGLTQDIKQSLLACFANTMWSDSDGQDYYDDLEEALYPFDLLSSITAVYTQSGTVYDTDSLDSLKADLVVTANYLDSTYKTVTDYTLSGTLVDGTSTITVTYGGKTTTFNVTVTGTTVTLVSIEATYTQSGTVYSTDSLDSLKADLVVTATYSDTSTATIPSTDYTLSGTLAVGTSTITVTYEGKTDTFNVTVSQSAATLTSISAVYTQSGTVYDTDTLDSLKTDLVVTAHYSDSTTATVSSSDYTLSGTLTVGTSTVTVTYSGFTTTFTVTVTEHIDTRTLVNNWDFTSSLTDTVGGSTAALTGATQDSTGVHLTASGNRCICNGVITTATDREIELDITEYARQGSDHGRFMMLSGTTGFIYRKTGRWALYLNGAWTDSTVTASNAFNGKTIKMKLDWVDTMVNVSIWCDGAKIVEAQETSANILASGAKMIGLGSGQSNSAYNSTFTGLRIYEV